jgi:hypothetical protein
MIFLSSQPEGLAMLSIGTPRVNHHNIIVLFDSLFSHASNPPRDTEQRCREHFIESRFR